MAHVEHTQERTRSEVARYLREFADKLDPAAAPTMEADRDRKVTLVSGSESATIKPPETLAFDVEVDTDPGLLESGNEHVTTFRLRWDANHVEADDELTIE